MKNIEDIIRNNKDFFEEAEPSNGHLERFNRKLEQRFQVHTIKRSIVPYLLKAAVVTLLITLSSLMDMGSFPASGKQQNDSWPGITTIQRG